MVEVLSIKDFAEAVGVTPQAVYKKLNQKDSKLRNYVVMVGRQKKIDTKAITEVYGNNVTVKLNQLNNQELNNVKQPVESDTGMAYYLKEELQKEKEAREKDREMYLEQLRQKDKQIDRCNDLLDSLTKQLEQSQLQATREQELLYLQMGGKIKEDHVETEPVEEVEPVEETEQVEETEEAKPLYSEPKKQGLFSRWFG